MWEGAHSIVPDTQQILKNVLLRLFLTHPPPLNCSIVGKKELLQPSARQGLVGTKKRLWWGATLVSNQFLKGSSEDSRMLIISGTKDSCSIHFCISIVQSSFRRGTGSELCSILVADVPPNRSCLTL